MNQAALGFRAHSGWTSLVAIALEDGSPMVLLRQRPQLVKTFTYEFRQPYHTAEKVPRSEARGVISHIQAEARGLAHQAIRSVQKRLLMEGYELQCGGLLLASGRPLPSLPQILASHALIHTADGELFRNVLLHACRRCGIEIFTAKESELMGEAGEELGLEPEEMKRRLADLGVGLGPPWTQDEKLASLIAWTSLAKRRSRKK
ncbi:MAG TPA: hypothetical protein VK574_18865 [Terracidiphilus sp.]|nr:hypothetical protein [Terracidiphilus sp.]